MSKIMAVDIGFAHTGIVVMEKLVDKWIPAEMVCLHTTPSAGKTAVRVADDDASRVMWQAGRISSIIKRHEIKRMVVELPHGGAKSARAIRTMALASAMIATIAEFYEMAHEWYPPKATRLAACGKSNASKDEVMEAMGRVYPTLEREMPTKADREHVADALATFEAARTGNLVRSA